MKLYRLATRNAGIWQYLDSAATLEAERKLNAPCLADGFGMGGIYFFTARGYKAFKKVNRAACKAAKSQGEHIYLLTLRLEDIAKSDIIYRDDNQVAVSFRHFNPGKKNICEYTACIERCK